MSSEIFSTKYQIMYLFNFFLPNTIAFQDTSISDSSVGKVLSCLYCNLTHNKNAHQKIPNAFPPLVYMSDTLLSSNIQPSI